jgi:hypothetical protein
VFDGRYRFSRYFSPIHFNRPTTYEALVANNDLEVFDLQEDPEETHNLAQDGPAKGVRVTGSAKHSWTRCKPTSSSTERL